ncbi:MAG: hypothetical protein JW928_05710 [Candidatus Aureabacteria bacterium]|nr:hypothetical protein [Candidatus Auribacterota bacterium]
MKIEEKDGALVIVDFNDLEAYKIARKVEKDGIAFYNRLLDLALNEKTRDVLRILLEEEKKHLKFFEDMMFSIREEEWFEKEDDLLDDLNYGIFPDNMPELEVGQFLDRPEKAVGLGIVMEKRTIEFYQACQERVLNEKAKKEIEKIIEKESEHKNILQGILKDIKAE